MKFPSDTFSLPPAGVWWVIALLFVAITAGTAVRRWSLRRADNELVRERMTSLKTWWVLAALLAVATVAGRGGASILFAVASTLALIEFLRLVPLRPADQSVVPGLFVLLGAQYLIVLLDVEDVFPWFVPIAALLWIGTRLVLAGTTDGFLRSAGSLMWGTMLLVYGLAHAPALFLLPNTTNPLAAGAGWFLYLIVLAQANDIAQALCGRRLGRRKITPQVSPHKTWEGLLGGILSTVVLAVLLSPFLTPLLPVLDSPDGSTMTIRAEPLGLLGCWAVGAGFLISIAGFFGDINMSAIKRDAGVKDSGTLLPGQGGVIDRIDGLTYSAPLFYYYIRWVCE